MKLSEQTPELLLVLDCLDCCGKLYYQFYRTFNSDRFLYCFPHGSVDRDVVNKECAKKSAGVDAINVERREKGAKKAGSAAD
uniref:Uncharacterized protein n=1 Tax=Panagrolaimus davidi TaxID=227884 RepID=A0A914Q6L3_9BILA